MANETDSEKGKTAPKLLDQGQPIERAFVAPDGTITIPHGEAKLTSVDIADIDLLLSFSDGTFVVIPNGALDATSETPPPVIFNDNHANLGDLFKKVGISNHAKAGSLRVVSGNVDAPKTLEDVDPPKPQENELFTSNDVRLSDAVAAPAPMVKVGKGPGLGTSGPSDQLYDSTNPLAPAPTLRPPVYRAGTKAPEIPPSITLDHNVTVDNIINIAESHGNIAIAGTVHGAQVGDTVTLTVNNNTYTGVVATGRLSTDLTFSINVAGSDLASDPDHTIDARITTPTGTATDTGRYGVDIIAPIKPSIAAISNDSGIVGDHLTNDQTLIFRGSAEANSSIEVFVNGSSVGTSITDGTGHWSFDNTGTTLIDGTYSVTATATDAAGNTSDASDAYSIKIDTSAIVKPQVTAISTDSGAVGDHITNDTTLVFSGAAEANTSVEVFVNGITVGHSTADSTGIWNFDYTGTTLVDGTYSVTAISTNAAGNASVASDPYSVIIDTIVAAPGIALTTDSGSSNSDLITNIGTLALGNIETGATVEYSIDNGATWTGNFTAVEGANTVQVRQTDIAGNTSSAGTLNFTFDTLNPVAPTVALATDSGTSSSDLITNVGTLTLSGIETGATVEYSINNGATWSSSFTAVEGANNVQVRQTDVAGNTSSANSLAFTLDTIVAAPGVTLTTDSGTSNSDLITNVGTLTLSGIEAGATVEYSIDNGATWTSSFTAVEGANNVEVRQTDIAGNTSGAGNLSFTLDTIVAAPGVALTTDSGTSNSDLITNIGTLALSGIEAGATVEYSIDNGATWTGNFTAVEGANTVQVRQTDVAGNTSSAGNLSFILDTISPAVPTVALATDSGTSNSDLITNVGTLALGNIETGATVEYSIDNGATWSSSFTAVEGANSVEVRQTDVAGNTSSASSLAFTLDTIVAAPGVALTTDSGSSNSDLITNVSTLTLSGIETGATVEYSIDNGATWTGNFTAVEGANNVEVRQTDIAGNTSSAGTLNFTFDTLNPVAPTVALATDSGTSSSDLITNVGTLTLSGIETGATVEYSINNGATWSSSFTAVEGANNVQVRQTDVAGNTSSANSLAFTLDTIVAAPGVTLTTDSGTSNSDLITNVGTLTLSGIEAGATVEYSIDNGATWTSSFTAVEGANNVEVRQTDIAGNTSGAGNLSFTLDTIVAAPGVALTTDSGTSNSDLITNIGTLALSGIEAGATVEYSIDNGATWTGNFTAVEGANTVQVRQTDVAGNTSSAGNLSFILDTISPAVPTVALATDSGTSNSDLITNVGTLALGNIETGATVEYSIDNGATWSSSFTAVEGANSVEVRQTDVAGNTSSASSLAFTLDTIVAAPGVALTTDSGTSNSDLITNVSTLTLSGIETGATVEYSIDNGATWTGNFTAVEGANTVQVRQTDVAGNTSSAGNLSFILDTISPAVPTVALATDSGTSSSDLITNVGTLTLSGIETGATVEYSIDNGATWSSSFTAVEGANNVQVRQTDVAGNTSSANSLAFTLDTIVAAPGVTLTTDSGTSNSDLITNVGTLTLSGIEAGATVEYSIDNGATWTSSFTAVEGANNVEVRQTDIAGNTSGAGNLSFTLDTIVAAPGIALTTDSGSSNSDLITNIGTLALSGIEAGATVEYSIDNGATWTGNFTAVEGANTVQVRQTDVAGNTSSAGNLSFILDTISPAVPTVALATDSGTSNSDLITNVGTLALGNIETGATVEYSIDNGATWSSSFTAVEGANSVEVRQTDVAGNTSSASSLAFTLDTSAPIKPTITGISDDTGLVGDHLTSDKNLFLNGIAEANSTIEVFVNGASVGTTTTGGTGSWSFDYTGTTLVVGTTYNVAVQATDVAGNTSAISNIYTVTIDATPPIPHIFLDSNIAGDGIVNIAEAGGVVAVTGTVTGDAKVGDTVTLTVNSATYTGLVQGDFTFSINVHGSDLVAGPDTKIDASITTYSGGIAGTATDSGSYTIDITPPVPMITLAPNITADNIINIAESAGAVAITGTVGGDAHVGDTVTLTLNGVNSTGQVKTGNIFSIYVSGSDLAADSSITASVKTYDPAGNPGTATASIGYGVDIIAPTAPTIALTSDTGASNSDNISKTGAITLTGLEAGATVEYSINGGTNWSSSFVAAEGSNNVQVRQTDLAGNTGSVGSLMFTLDTIVAAPGVALTTDSGTSSNDHISNVGTLALTGVETGATVEYSIDNGATWSSSFTAIEGANNVEVRQTDLAGNTSGANSLSFTLDTIVAAPGVALATDSGTSNSDLITNVGTLALSGIETGATVEYSIDNGATWSSSFTAVEGANNVEVRQTDLAGNTSGVNSLSFTLDTIVAAPGVALATDSGTSNSDLITNIGTLALGNIETSATVEYSIDNGATWSSSFTAVEGANSVEVRQTDVAGNTSSASSLAFTLDTIVAAPGVALTTDSGTSNSDLITNVGTLTLSGIEAGATVEYSIDNGATWTGNFTAVEGANTVQVRQTDVAGNTSSAGNLSFILDTLKPVAPTVALTTDSGSSNSDLITNVGTLALGNIETGATVEYSIDNGSTWTGSFTAVEGANTVQVRQTDIAGNTGSAGSLAFTLDTIVAAPGVALATDSGTSNSDLITNVGTLALSGIETGATVEYSIDNGATWTSSFTAIEGANNVEVRQTDLAGNTSNSSSLSFTLDTVSAAPGVALTTDSGTSSSDHITNVGILALTGIESGASVQYSIDNGSTWIGSFTAVEGANNVEVRQTDLAGNTSSASSLSFTLDTIPPFKPSITAISNDSGIVGDHITNDQTLIFSGSAEANSSVQVFVNGSSIGTTIADGTGAWSFDNTGTTLTNGSTYSVTAQATDTAGNISAPSDGYNVTIATTVAQPSVTSISIDSGIVGDHITNDQTLIFSGSAVANSSVEVFINGSSVGTTIADGTGTWSYDNTGTALANGSVYSVTAQATDAAGNTSALSDSYSVVIDTAAPAKPSITAINTDSGVLGDHITNDQTLIYHGTAESNSSVQVFVNGVAVGTTIADGTGAWSYDNTGTTLANGSTYSVTAQATDAAGNTSEASVAYNVTIDTFAAAPGVALATDSGSSNSDHNTNIGTLALTGIETGATVEYSIDNGTTWTSSFTASEGINNVQVHQIDVAGNTSSAGSISFTLDTLAPAAPTVALTSDTGASSTDLITKSGTLSLTGIEAGAIVEYSTNGGLTWNSSFTASEGINNVQVHQIDVAGNIGSASSISFTLDTTVAAPTVALTNDTGSSSTDLITKTGTLSLTGIEAGAIVEYSTNGGLTWNSSFTASEGINNVQVHQIDVAGNTSSVGSISFTLDTLAPTAPTVALTSDTGASNTDLITKTGTLSLTGIEAGAIVEYSTNGGLTWNSSFTASEGINNVQVHQIDVAGNIGSASSISFTLDTTVAAPTVALTNDTGSSSTDLITKTGTLSLTGIEAGAIVEYSTNGGLTWNNSFTASEGINNVQVHQIDVAGNQATSNLTFTLDTTVAAPTVTLTSDTGSSSTDLITMNGNISLTGIEAGAIVEYSTNGGLTWNSSFTASEGINSVQVHQTDVAGNTSSAGSLTFTFDTTAPNPAIAIADITGDNSISIPESLGNVAITGTAGGDAKVGDTITLTVNGTDYSGTVAAGRIFSIDVAGSDLVADADKTIDARINTIDLAGNPGSASISKGYTLDNTLVGTDGNDILIGNGADNILIGGIGNDTLEGMGGADSLIGGGGNDTASYTHATTGVFASLTTSFAALQTGDAAGDTFTSTENLAGSNFNDTLIGDTFNNILTGGLGDDVLEGRAGADTLDGGGGIDTASYINSVSAIRASLANSATNTGVEAAGDTYLSIENLTGSNFNDTLIGDAFNNILTGATGADALDGGGGIDTASYANAASGVTASLDASLFALQSGDAAGDTFTSIENLTGSAFNDILIGDGGINSIFGGAGDDILEGMGGGDILNGGSGNNTASYEHATGGVHASLTNPISNTGDALGDSYINIHNLTGSAFADILTGDGGDNILIGGAGADILNGGAGNDTASYANAATGVFASLNSIYAPFQSGDAAGDTFTSIENLTGSAHNDTLIGNSSANTLTGGAGNDALDGQGGADILYGGTGSDTIYANQGHDSAYGGDNNDTFYVSSLSGNLPTIIDGGARDAGGDGNVMVLQDLVNNGSYNMSALAGVTVKIDTLDISGDAAATAITISSQNVQHMVDNGNASQLLVKADSGDTLNISLAAGETMTPTVIDAAHTDYTIFNAAHTQIAQIHWQTA